MTSAITKSETLQPQNETAVHLFDNWIDPLETEIRGRVRGFIEEVIRSELDAALARPRYGRPAKSLKEVDGVAGAAGHRHGSRSRTLMGTFGKVEIDVPRARLQAPDGKTREWRSSALRAYQRRTLAADALIAGTYLAGTNTRRVRRALGAVFGGAVGKDTVSRVWRKVKSDWDAWNARSLADEPIVRLILDYRRVEQRVGAEMHGSQAQEPARACAPWSQDPRHRRQTAIQSPAHHGEPSQPPVFNWESPPICDSQAPSPVAF
jgi:transposase-like protein